MLKLLNKDECLLPAFTMVQGMRPSRLLVKGFFPSHKLTWSPRVHHVS